jgi:SDR family mycofactocin-dependent oxidoreductase
MTTPKESIVTGLEGKVAFITGAARGQGRSHAVRLARLGADIVATDRCADLETVPYPLADDEDLQETARLVEKEGRRCVAARADVRDEAALQAAVDAGLAEFGRIDVVVANAGIAPIFPDDVHTDATLWGDVIDVNLTGVYNTVRLTVPAIIAGERGGSIVLISSTAGLKGNVHAAAGGFAYTAAKHGVVGLMRAYANELAPHSIRVNTVHPTGVATVMVENDTMAAYLASVPEAGSAMQNALPISLLAPGDISDAVCWLASDAARYVTGVTLPVDAGYLVR